jgi:hypothetical protein
MEATKARKQLLLWLINAPADPFPPGIEIWTALKAAVESDIDTARLIVESAGIIVPGRDLSTCWDTKGALYSLPKYVLSAPTNLTMGD